MIPTPDKQHEHCIRWQFSSGVAFWHRRRPIQNLSFLHILRDITGTPMSRLSRSGLSASHFYRQRSKETASERSGCRIPAGTLKREPSCRDDASLPHLHEETIFACRYRATRAWLGVLSRCDGASCGVTPRGKYRQTSHDHPPRFIRQVSRERNGSFRAFNGSRSDR